VATIAASDRRSLLAACAAMSVFGLALGMTYPLLSLILASRGVTPDMIGINAAMMPIGILLFSPVIPLACRRFGPRAVAMGAAVATLCLLLAFKLFDNLAAWFVLRLLQGMSVSTLFILSEAWIVSFAGDAHRGKVVAIYAALLSATFGAGPAIIGWIGIEGWRPFLIGAAVLAVGILPIGLVRPPPAGPTGQDRAEGLLRFAGKAPMLLLAVAAFAVFDVAVLSLMPVYGLQLGLDLQTAANALTALIVGNVVLQFPIGWLADRFPRRAVLAGCATGTSVMLLLLPVVMGRPWMWPTLVLAGACAYGVYTVSLSALGDRFRGEELLQGSSAFALMWGLGALAGSVSSGWAMRGAGPHALPLLLAGVFALLALGVGIRVLRLRAAA
jgi:MFS family permease